MIDIPLKKAGGFELPVLGLGTWLMGGRYTHDPFNDDARDVAAIKVAIEMGITHIDTAEIYAGGHAEELVGQAIRDFDRSKLFITSKVSGDNLSYDRVMASARESLERLGIDQLDLYLIHWPNSGFEIKETMRAMDDLVLQGLIMHIGVSNFNAQEMVEAQAALRQAQGKPGGLRIVNNQINYSLPARGHEQAGTLDFAAKNNILITAYRPLAKGEFSHTEEKILKKLAEKYQKTPLQIALNWVINKPNIVALVKTSNIDHLKEDLGALGWELEREDEKYLDDNFPKGPTMGVGVEP